VLELVIARCEGNPLTCLNFIFNMLVVRFFEASNIGLIGKLPNDKRAVAAGLA